MVEKGRDEGRGARDPLAASGRISPPNESARRAGEYEGGSGVGPHVAVSPLGTEPARLHGPPSNRRRWTALVVLCVGQLMIVLDATVVNVALPTIQRDLHFSQSSLAWVINAYLITFGGSCYWPVASAISSARRRCSSRVSRLSPWPRWCADWPNRKES